MPLAGSWAPCGLACGVPCSHAGSIAPGCRGQSLPRNQRVRTGNRAGSVVQRQRWGGVGESVPLASSWSSSDPIGEIPCSHAGSIAPGRRGQSLPRNQRVRTSTTAGSVVQRKLWGGVGESVPLAHSWSPSDPAGEVPFSHTGSIAPGCRGQSRPDTSEFAMIQELAQWSRDSAGAGSASRCKLAGSWSPSNPA